MNILLVPDSAVPAYLQIVDQLRLQIASGRLATGDVLTSVRKEAATLRVNPMTVSKAYGVLAREGLVSIRRGVGVTVVASRLPNVDRLELLRPAVVRLAEAARQLSLDRRDVADLLIQVMAESA